MAAQHRHYPGLDALRGLAAFSVALAHYFGSSDGLMPKDKLFENAWVGVDLFFVLSGFLISGILYDSLQQEGYFRTFYLRRTLRIFPLYYGVLFLLLLLTPVLHIQWSQVHLLWPLYVTNLSHSFYQAANIPLKHPIGLFHQFVVAHFWSLCVEEQFYICWPLVVYFVRRREWLMRLCLAALVLSMASRFFMLHHGADSLRLYVFTPLRVDGLILGAWLAFALRGDEESRERVQRRLTVWLPMIGMVCIAVLLGMWVVNPISIVAVRVDGPPVGGMQTYGYLLVDLAALALVYIALDEKHPLTRWLLGTPLSRLGKVSYGFYIFHMLFYDLQWRLNSEPFMHNFQLSSVLLHMILCYIAAKLSFRYFESPFLRFKERFAPRVGSRAAYPRPDPL